MKIFNLNRKRYKAVDETKPEPESDNLGDLMQNYNYSICIQENSAQQNVRGFILWIN